MKTDLIKMFTENVDFTKAENIEVLLDAFDQIYARHTRWNMLRSKDDKNCVRSCKIVKGEVFCKYEIEKNKFIYLCPRCMAMILFFGEAYKKSSVIGDW